MPQNPANSSSPEHPSGFPTINRSSLSLKQDHSLLSAIVHDSDDAILSKTLDGIITTWNPAAERMFGYTAAEIIGKPKTILFPPDRLHEEVAILDRLRLGIATDHFETVRRHKDGTLLHVSVTISPLKNGDGHVIGASTIARDITERKRLEIAQREEEQFVSAVLDTASALVIVLDTEGRILRFNHACERATGWTFAEVEGKPFWDVLLLPEEARDVRHTFARLCAGDFPLRYENNWLTRNGDRRCIEFSNAALLHEDGSIQVIIGTGIDVTELRTAETANRSSEARYRALVELCPDALIVHRDFVLLFANPAALRLFGATDAAQMLGKNLLDFVHPDTRTLVMQRVQSLQTTEQETPAMEQQWLDLHGQPLEVEVRGNACDWQGERAVQVIVRDIREHRREEEQIRLFSTVLAGSMNGVVITDPQERILYVNPAFERIAGYTLEELRGRRPAETLQGPDTSAQTRGQVRAAIAAQEPITVEILNYHKNGTPYWIEMHITPVRGTEGKVSHFVAIENDITSRKQAEQQRQEATERLRISEERYALSVEGSQNGLWDLDVRTGEMHVSARWEEMIGYAEGEFPHHVEAWVAHLHPDDRPRLEAMASAYYHQETDVYEAEFRLRHKDGSYRWILSRGVGRFDGEGQPQRMAGSHMDITERKRLTEQLQTANEWQQDAIELLTLQHAELQEANARLEGLATTDGLTGLKNHRAFQDRLKEEYIRAVRYNSPLSVILLNVDNFKQYNDTFGHPSGDGVLTQVATILQCEVRNTDIVTRYGGEEFALILPETGAEEARHLAERLRQALAAASWEKDAVTASFGVATVSPMILNATALVTDANKAMYRSKYRGRNRVTHIVDAMEEETLDTYTLESFNNVVQSALTGHGEMLVSASAQVKEKLVQSYNATIASWSRLLDLRDKETEGHSKRVTDKMVQLTQHLGFNEQEVLFARWGAWLHDIGKMAVPDHILHKPGPLTEEEWVLMRQHTTVAYEMLQSIEFLGPAIDIPYCHHEKWDGSGYPRGLKGDEIPWMARLFAVIDVYDALTSDRPYRQAWAEEKVRTHLQEQAGTHFDPRAVEAFLSLLEAHDVLRQAA